MLLRLSLAFVTVFAFAAISLPLGVDEILSVRSLQRPLLWPVFAGLALLLVPWSSWWPTLTRGLGYTVLVLWAAFVLLSPGNKRTHFARDVGLLTLGMTPTNVERVMAAHVKGVQDPMLVGLAHGGTYFEPRNEHHSFDEYVLVHFESGRAERMRVVFD